MQSLSASQRQKVADQIRILLSSKDEHEIITGTIGLLRLVEGDQGLRFKSLTEQLQHANKVGRAPMASGLMPSLKREASGYLKSIPVELDIDLSPGHVPSAIDRIERLCRRFHRMSIELRHRRKGRPIFDVTDEYDVQDLFRSILSLEFDDVRPEDPSPTAAGASSRIDFVLSGEGVVVEAKMARESLLDKELGEELLVDIARYTSHPSSQTLVCFVYDPKHFLRNPDGLIADLESRSTEMLAVRVFIEPTK